MNRATISEFAGGTVARLTNREFGFIRQTDCEKDLFFHSNELVDILYAELREGDELHFEIVESSKGQVAVNISRNGFGSVKLDEKELDAEKLNAKEEFHIAVSTFVTDLVKRVANNPAILDELEWRDMERLIAEAFLGLGFDVELTPASKDGGKDVVLTYKGMSYVVEIKHWRSGKRVGQVEIEKFLHVVVHEKRNAGLLLSTSGYCNNAFEYLNSFERRKLRFGTDEKVVCLCRNYMKSKGGIWRPPEQIEDVIFDSTI